MELEKYLLNENDFKLELLKVKLGKSHWGGFDFIEQINSKVKDYWGNDFDFYSLNWNREEKSVFYNGFVSSRLSSTVKIREMIVEHRILEKYQSELIRIENNVKQLQFYYQRNINEPLLNLASWVVDYLPTNTYQIKKYEASNPISSIHGLVKLYKDGLSFFKSKKDMEDWSNLLGYELNNSVYVEYDNVSFFLYTILTKEQYTKYKTRIENIGVPTLMPLLINRLFVASNCYTEHLVPNYLKIMSESEFFIHQKSNDIIENFIRLKLDLPLKGEGWINELILYNRLKQFNGDVHTFHQVKFKWLGRQSVDIYLSNKKLAIEFQGIQHSKAVDFFGGNVGLMKNQKRDLKKKNLLLQNGVSLLYVLPNYRFEEVADTIIKHESSNVAFYEIGSYE
jgi:very-short-patch-repair endonuclease